MTKKKNKLMKIWSLIISVIPIYGLLWMFDNIISMLKTEFGIIGQHIGIASISILIGVYFLIYFEEFN